MCVNILPNTYRFARLRKKRGSITPHVGLRTKSPSKSLRANFVSPRFQGIIEPRSRSLTDRIGVCGTSDRSAILRGSARWRGAGNGYPDSLENCCLRKGTCGFESHPLRSFFMNIKRILLTGDDGYNSLGTRLLIYFLKDRYELAIAGTKHQQSGVGGHVNVLKG